MSLSISRSKYPIIVSYLLTMPVDIMLCIQAVQSRESGPVKNVPTQLMPMYSPRHTLEGYKALSIKGLQGFDFLRTGESIFQKISDFAFYIEGEIVTVRHREGRKNYAK